MKILYVYKNYYPILGGIENHVRMLASGLVERGHEVTVLVASGGPRTVREVRDGVKLIRAGLLFTAARTPVSLQLFFEMARQRPDITHLHFPYPIGELAHLLVGRGRRFVITYHSDVVKQRTLLRFYEPALWRVLARADRIIATSPNYLRSSRYLSRVADKCVAIPAAVDDARFYRRDEAAIARLRATYEGPLVLFVGLFRYYKGLQYLVEAMRDVPARLLLVGGGPLEAELRQQVAREGLTGKVHFAGVVSDEDLPSYYHACDVFVLPSSQRSEALGLSQIEAMCCAKPVVCTELGTGTSWANLDGVTGLVVPPRDPAALAAALCKLLADPELRRRFGRAALLRSSQEFSKDVLLARIELLYKELVHD